MLQFFDNPFVKLFPESFLLERRILLVDLHVHTNVMTFVCTCRSTVKSLLIRLSVSCFLELLPLDF